jgi:hypothetical protein
MPRIQVEIKARSLFQSPKIVSAALLIALSSVAAASEAQIGRCHQDVCSWRKQLSRELIGSSTGGALFRVTYLGGSGPDGGRRTAITWNRKPHDVFVFCSKKLPAVMLNDGGSLQVDALELSPSGSVPPVQYSAASVYLAVCHNTPGDDPQVAAKRFKYNLSAPELDALTPRLKAPEDVLKIL